MLEYKYSGIQGLDRDLATSILLSTLADTFFTLPSLCCGMKGVALKLFWCSHFEGSSKLSGTSKIIHKPLYIISRAWPSAHQGPCQGPLCVRDWSFVESSALECQQEKSYGLWGEIQWNALFVRTPSGYKCVFVRAFVGCKCVCVGACASAWLLNLVLVYYWWVFQAHAPWA